ncbi:MAG: PQQ-binding-like beta-propeller repeat protein [Nannocystaceae bacterium]|nr:PQQ-binding-like beta-propeller repeat protein [Nannocystaceae bacterium]
MSVASTVARRMRGLANKATRSARQGLAGACLVALVSCSPTPQVVLIHPEGGDGAREVLQVEFSQTLTAPDNFVLRPDEFGGVAVDHARKRLYVGSRDAFLIALDTTSGRVAWEHQLSDSVSGIPVVANLSGGPGAEENDAQTALVIVGTDNGVLHAIDVDTQASRWRYETPGRIRNAPIVAEDTVYFTNSRDQIFALDVRTGEWRWQYEQEFSNNFTVYGRAGLTFVPAAADELAGEIGTIYTGFDNGRVVALGATSGQALWLANVAPPEGGDFVDCDSTPWVDKDAGMLVVSGQSTGVHALSLEDGSMLWRYPVLGAGTVVGTDDGSLIAASSLEGLLSLDAHGGLQWRTEIDPGVLQGPVVVQGTVFLTHSDLGLMAFDTLSGEMLAQLRTGSGISTPPTFDPIGQRLYVTSNRGRFLSLRVGDGLLSSPRLP